MDHMDANTEEEEAEEEKQAELEEGSEDEKEIKEEMMTEGNENMDKDTSDAGKAKLSSGSDAATGAFGVSLKRPINSILGFFGASAKNASGLAKLAGGVKPKEGMETEELMNKEGFLGMNLVNNLNKFTKNITSSLSNITDLDRSIKTNAESNTIASTKDFN